MKHLIFIFLASARGLPQLQETDRDVAEVVAVLEAQLPDDIKDSVYNAFQVGVGNTEEFIDAVVDKIDNTSLVQGINNLFKDTVSSIQNPDSSLHFLLEYLPEAVLQYIPASARTGPVGATVGIVIFMIVLSNIISLWQKTYHLWGEYVPDIFIFPESVEMIADEAARAGRALLSDPATLDNLHQGVMKAVDKYNQLQEIYGEY